MRENIAVKTVLPSEALSVVVIIGLSALSFLEHVRSPRSSDGINIYLFFSIIFDAAQVRTLWLRFASFNLAIVASICLGLKFVLLLVEAQGKRRYLVEKYRALAPETLCGVFARRLFWWLNGMLLKGYRSLMQPDQLESIKEDFASSDLLKKVERNYFKRTVFRDSSFH